MKNCTTNLSDRLPSIKGSKRKVRTQDEVLNAFNSRGWLLLSQYKNTAKPLRFICDKGHHHKISWGHFARGENCGVCAGTWILHDDVEKAFRDRGWTLLSQYKNSGTHLSFICDKGHHHKITWNLFRRGCKCQICFREGRRTKHGAVAAAFKARGYTLLSQYKRCDIPLEFICDKGHRHQISWDAFQRGQQCAICAGKIVTHGDVKAAFDTRGYTLLSQYEDSKSPLRFVCDRGHYSQISWGSFRRGSRCRNCCPGGYEQCFPGVIYYVRFDPPGDAPIYKIGITNHSVARRFKDEKTPYVVLWQQLYEDGSVPPQLESAFLRKHKKCRYTGSVLASGNTECFTRDVLGYDRAIAQLQLLP